MKVSRGLLAGVMLTLAVPVAAQTLGELAKREAERRKAAPPATKTYTNEDLKKVTAFPGGETPKDAEGKDAKESKDATAKDSKDAKDSNAKGSKDAKESKDAKDPAKDENYWRGLMAGVREEIRKNEMFRDALQTKINSLTADFTNRDDPYQRARIADERQKALAQLAQLNSDIDKANKRITEIEDEARKAGVPPGWVR